MIATRIGSDCYSLDRHSTDLGCHRGAEPSHNQLVSPDHSPS